MNVFLRNTSLQIINTSTVRLILFLSLQFCIKGDICENIHCSNIFDYVCGVVRTNNGNQFIVKYQNICHLDKIRCRLKHIVDIYKVPDILCHIKRAYTNGRRVNDFSIIGAHEACNHTCPTYCTDIYEPACAQIWKPNMISYSYRPMINHCHIDLFSCALGVNVTIQPLGKCYKNPSGLLFMSQIAAMKSLKLLDDVPLQKSKKTLSKTKQNRRLYNNANLKKNPNNILKKLYNILLMYSKNLGN